MTYSQLKDAIAAKTIPVLQDDYYNHLKALTDYIDLMKSKLDTIDEGAKVPLTPNEVIAKINTSTDKITLSHINIPDGSFTIAKTDGLSSAISGKAASSHIHAQSEITGLTSAISGKANTVHIHAIEDVTDLSTNLSGKALTNHKHNHADCIENGSGTSHDDHDWALSRIKQGAPSDANLLETQITYKSGVAPAALQDVARMQDIVNAINGKYSKTVSGTLTEDYVDISHGLSSTSFIINARVNFGAGLESVIPTVTFTDANNFRVFLGSGYSGLAYEISWIWIENSTPPVTTTTEIPVYLLPGTSDGVIPENNRVQVTHYLDSTNFIVEGWVDYSGSGELEKCTINVTIDGPNSFTADFGSGMSGLTYKLTWVKKLV